MFTFIPAYICYALLIVIGIVGMAIIDNFIKRLMALGIFQVGILFFYISICYKSDLTSPILQPYLNPEAYINPIPQVLMLTAIVVSLSITCLALAIIVKISEKYHTILESKIDLKGRDK